MGLATLPSPSEGMFILLLVNTASSFAMVKELFRIILHALGIHLPSDCDPCSAAWSSPPPAPASPDPCQTRVSYAQQLIDDFRCRSPPVRFKAVACGAVQQKCPVCLNHFEPESKIYKLGCGHLFHNACLEKWLKLNYWNTTCPLCRTPVMPQEEDPDCFCN
uniref:RING-type domain-containing protein n=1 Tax=Kalanchoe fedtschenkoi TaxID=63787 RepID=A0A7N0TEC7_KALFE